MKIHGSWKLSVVCNDTMLVRVFGAWNKEASEAFADEFKQISRPLIDKPWALVVCMQYGELVVPEAISVLEALNQWAINNNCRREANVVKYQIHNHLIDHTRGNDVNEYVQRSFTEMAEAISYLKSQGFADSLSVSHAEQALSE